MRKIRSVVLISVFIILFTLTSVAGDHLPVGTGLSTAYARTPYTCDGNLIVTAQVWNSLSNPIYRLNGTGPGLPVTKSVTPSTWVTLEFTLAGPGSWSNLILEYANNGVAPWIFSGHVLGVTCEAPDYSLSDLLKTAVGGKFVSNANLYWTPGEATQPLVTIPAGNTALVTQMNAARTYYQIVWNEQLLWVPAGTLAPNPDAVWKGAPLPGPASAYGTTTTSATVSYFSGVITGSAAGYPVYNASKTASTYTVQAGDNLFRIAIHFGVNLSKLASVNGITDVNKIYVGQVLDIAAAR